MDPPTADEPLSNVRDAALFLQVSESWVYHRTADGRLPHFRVGASLRCFPAEIQAHVRGTKPESARVASLVGRRTK